VISPLFSQSRHEAFVRIPPAGQTRRWLSALAAPLGRVLAGSGERRVRLRTLTVIRWIAIIGQAFTIALVHFSLEFRLPLWPLLSAVGLSALINLVLTAGFPATTRLTERAAALLLGYDILQLAFLLGLTGGLQNPFAILLIVPVTLSATTLSLRTTVVLCLFVVMAATLLALYPTDLPWYEGSFRLPALYVGGLWLALVLGTALIAGYAWRVADEARRLSDALAATQMALAREQQLSALGGLAAAAAHELGSPLATIAVTARELANSVPPDSPLAEDIAELVSESQRCREILRSLSQKGESEEHTPFTRMPLSNLLETVADSCRHRPGVTVTSMIERATHLSLEPQLVPTPELRHALANLIDNAIQFAEHEVRIVVSLDPEQVEVRVEDDGAGFPAEVLELLGEPYLSTRNEAGGLGLGIFIAQTLLARTGATLQFGNLGRGARVTITWMRAILEGHAPEI
jgi:two-component system sensor histidine kinase RegB